MRKRETISGFTLVELMVTLVISSLLIASLYNFLSTQRKHSNVQRVKANLESMAQLAFFVIGRDIRRAGSNPRGWGTYAAGEAIAFESATDDRLIIRADLNGDGVVTADTDERVIYEWVDDTDNPDGTPDQIRRQAGNQLVIENVKTFEFCYYMTGGFWDCNPTDPALIKKIRMKLIAGSGKTNPNTGVEDTKEIQMIIRPRNFDL